MNPKLSLLALAALTTCGAFPPPAFAFQNPPTQTAVVELDLEDDIDDSVKFLRFAQSPDGSYDGNVTTTALVLRAMEASPRHYLRRDGPFVQKALDWLVAHQAADGSIHDKDADAAAVARQTRMAAAVLALNAHVSTEDALHKALGFIGTHEPDAAPWNDAQLPEDRAALAAMAKSLLAKRAPDYSWDGPEGKLRTTAERIVTLSRVHKILEPAPKAKPSSVKPLPAFQAADKAQAIAAAQRGAAWLAAQSDKGRFGPPGSANAGMTAMAIGGLLAAPEPRAKPVQDAIDQGLAWLVSLQKPDGSIHDGALANYTTSAAILALVGSGKAEYKPVVAKARDFLITLQADEGEGYSPDHPYYGGNSYGDEQRPDMSNVQMALEALHAAGVGKDDPAFQRALVFLQRCQNRSESNDVKLVDGGTTTVSGDDGGGVYTPGTSKAGFVELADGKRVPRSYGSMSYALLKGFVFAGLPKTDPRMQACWEWLRKNYTLDVNPGFETLNDPTAAYQGLYYYFHTMARALDAYGEETIVDAEGKSHAWRKDLAGRLVALQTKSDGSWTNENSPRWFEGNKVLATSYALITLGVAAK